MSKVYSQVKGLTSVSTEPGGLFGYTNGLQVDSVLNVITTQYLADSTIVMPEGAFSVTAKLWGAGGQNGSGDLGTILSIGGGGGSSICTISVLPGDTLFLSIGKINTGGAGGIGGINNRPGGAGGGMSMVHTVSGSNYTVKAVAAGGGGGGGGGGGNSGGNGGGGGLVGGTGAFGSGGGAGNGGTGGLASAGVNGYNGVNGTNFINTVSNLSLVGGDGGGGGNVPATNGVSAGGGAGDGYGGGGGGGANGGGGGGGNYSFAGTTANGSGQTPGNASDIDYPAGTGLGAAKAISVGNGTAGAIVLIISTSIQKIQMSNVSLTTKAVGISIAGTNNISSGDGGNLLLSGGTSGTGNPGAVLINNYISYPSIRGSFPMTTSKSLYSDKYFELLWDSALKQPLYRKIITNNPVTFGVSIKYTKPSTNGTGPMSIIANSYFTQQVNNVSYYFYAGTTSDTNYDATGTMGSYEINVSAYFRTNFPSYAIKIFWDVVTGNGKYIIDIIPGF